MISALEGWQFLGPEGSRTFIRPQDHALNQPMFQVQLVKQRERQVYTDKVLKMIPPGTVAAARHAVQVTEGGRAAR